MKDKKVTNITEHCVVEWEEKMKEPLNFEEFLTTFIRDKEEQYNSLKETVKSFHESGAGILLKAIDEVYPNLIFSFLLEKNRSELREKLKIDLPMEDLNIKTSEDNLFRMYRIQNPITEMKI